jgi:DNA-binding FadR family transcriptional regulator
MRTHPEPGFEEKAKGMPPIAATKLGAQVTQRLLAVLGSGKLAPGEKLPPERELADMLGVSRTLVREALAALQLSGLLQRRQGVGTVILRVPTGSSMDSLESEVKAGITMTEVLDARYTFDMGLVHHLCEDRRYDFSEAWTLLDVMRLRVRQEENPSGYLSPSLEIHVALARATERPLVFALAEQLAAKVRDNIWTIEQHYNLDIARHSLGIHERLLQAIERRDLIASLAEVRKHYNDYPVLTRDARRT